MPESLHHILYVSRAVHPMAKAELAELVEEAHRRNAQQAITGILLYGSGNFIQLLEGRRATLQPTYRRIATDTRHQDVMTLIESPTRERLFGGWHMGLLMLDEGPELDCTRLLKVLHAIRQTPGAAGDRSRAEALAVLRAFQSQLGAPGRAPAEMATPGRTEAGTPSVHSASAA